MSAIGMIAITGCSSDETESINDPQMCDCLEAGETLSNFSSQLLGKEPTVEDQAKMKELKEAKAKACENYQMMSGEEMLKRKTECATDEE